MSDDLIIVIPRINDYDIVLKFTSNEERDRVLANLREIDDILYDHGLYTSYKNMPTKK